MSDPIEREAGRMGFQVKINRSRPLLTSGEASHVRGFTPEPEAKATVLWEGEEEPLVSLSEQRRRQLNTLRSKLAYYGTEIDDQSMRMIKAGEKALQREADSPQPRPLDNGLYNARDMHEAFSMATLLADVAERNLDGGLIFKRQDPQDTSREYTLAVDLKTANILRGIAYGLYNELRNPIPGPQR